MPENFDIASYLRRQRLTKPDYGGISEPGGWSGRRDIVEPPEEPFEASPELLRPSESGTMLSEGQVAPPEPLKTSALEEYRQYLSKEPKLSEYHPSKLRTI